MNFVKLIDFTNLKSETTRKNMEEFCSLAKEYNFRAVCIHPFWVKFCKESLKNSGVLVAAVNDFPFGQGGKETKIFQTELAKKMGADEIDTVINIGALKSGNYNLVLEELKAVTKILPTKVIIESGLLSDEEIKKAAEIVKDSGAEFIKTSTGYIANTDIDTKANHVRLIKKTVPDLKIKASGGIRTYKDLKILRDEGADIFGIGMSGALSIMKEILLLPE